MCVSDSSINETVSFDFIFILIVVFANYTKRRFKENVKEERILILESGRDS